MTISEYRDAISDLTNTIDSTVVGSKAYNDALTIRTAIQKDLNKIIADQQVLLQDEVR